MGGDALPRWAGWVAGTATALLVLGLWAWAGVAGMAWLDLVRATVSVLLTTLLPGVLVWRAVRPRAGWWAEDLGLGFGIGSVVALLAQVPAGLLGQGWLSAAVPLALAAVLLAVPPTRERIRTAETTRVPLWWWPLVGACMLFLVPQQRAYFTTNPVEWSGVARPHIDSPLHLSLTAQLAERGPTTFPWVQSEELGYHWLSHAWMAQVGVTSGAELDGVLLRFMPALMLIVVPVAIAAAGMRLTGKMWAGPAAAFLAVACGQMNAFGAEIVVRPIIPESPTLGLSVPMLMGLIVLLVTRWRGTALPGAWAVMVLLAIGASGTKGSATPLVVAGLGVAGLAMIVLDRRRVARIFVDGCLMVAALLFVVVTVFRGSGAGLHLSLADAARATWGSSLLGSDTFVHREVSATMAVLGVLTPAVVGLCLFAYKRWRDDPEPWFLLGCGLAGAGAIAVFGHPGNSQGYFATQAAPVLMLLAVLGISGLEDQWSRRQLGTVLLVAAPVGVVAARGPVMMLGDLTPGDDSSALLRVVLTVGVLTAGVVIAVLVTREQRRVVALAALGLAVIAGGVSGNYQSLQPTPREAAEPLKPDDFGVISRATVRAARFIREHSERDDVVMTNRHCYIWQDPARDGCDSRWFVVAAYSERQMLLEGWTATPRSAKEGPHGRDSITIGYWQPDLLALNDDFIADPTAEAARTLHDRYDVRWVFVDRRLPHAGPSAFAPYADKRASFRGIDVYELRG